VNTSTRLPLLSLLQVIYSVPHAHFLQKVAPCVVPSVLRETGAIESNLKDCFSSSFVLRLLPKIAGLEFCLNIVSPFKPAFHPAKYNLSTYSCEVSSLRLIVELIAVSTYFCNDS